MARSKGRSILWGPLNRVTAKLYRLLAGSVIGRVMTGYRRVDAAFAKGDDVFGACAVLP